MVLKLRAASSVASLWFENDVKMYGTQTKTSFFVRRRRFENDVKMYGTQTSANG